MEKNKKSALEISNQIGIDWARNNEVEKLTVHVLVRLADSCRIETYILSESDEHWDKIYDELVANGYIHQNTRVFKL